MEHRALCSSWIVRNSDHIPVSLHSLSISDSVLHNGRIGYLSMGDLRVVARWQSFDIDSWFPWAQATDLCCPLEWLPVTEFTSGACWHSIQLSVEIKASSFAAASKHGKSSVPWVRPGTRYSERVRPWGCCIIPALTVPCFNEFTETDQALTEYCGW